MKKLSIKKAASELDFNHEWQFIEYLDECRINGNYSSLVALFKELNDEAKKVVLLNVAQKTREYLIINAL